MSFGNTDKLGAGTAYWILQDSSGHPIVVDASSTVAHLTASGALVGAACQLLGLFVSASAAAYGALGDYVVIINGTGANGTEIMRVYLPVGNSTQMINCQSAYFNLGVYANISVSAASKVSLAAFYR